VCVHWEHTDGSEEGKRKVRTTATQQREEEERFHVRVPSDLKELVRAMAAEDGRTISNFLLQLVRKEAKRRGEGSSD
jgi:hypothetical protein